MSTIASRSTSRKKPRNRQHAAKGAAFILAAEKLHAKAGEQTSPQDANLLHMIADALAETGKEVRAKR